MPDPRKREHIGVGTRNDELRGDPNERAGIRVGEARISSSFDNGPFEEIQDPMALNRGPRVSESAFWPMMRGKPL